jgi:MFS family permease
VKTNNTSGINALIYYSPSLFETLGQDYEMQLLLSGIINCTQLVGVATSLWTMDRFGRRPLLLTGAALMFICHLIIAVLVGKFGGRWLDFAVEGWVAVAFLFFYMFSFGATWGPVPWAMPSEIFPSSLRAKGVALSTCSNWFNNFVIVSSQSTPRPIARS